MTLQSCSLPSKGLSTHSYSASYTHTVTKNKYLFNLKISVLHKAYSFAMVAQMWDTVLPGPFLDRTSLLEKFTEMGKKIAFSYK